MELVNLMGMEFNSYASQQYNNSGTCDEIYGPKFCFFAWYGFNCEF